MKKAWEHFRYGLTTKQRARILTLTAIPAFFIWLLGVWPLRRGSVDNLAE